MTKKVVGVFVRFSCATSLSYCRLPQVYVLTSKLEGIQEHDYAGNLSQCNSGTWYTIVMMNIVGNWLQTAKTSSKMRGWKKILEIGLEDTIK
jgi:hypothetical protein